MRLAAAWTVGAVIGAVWGVLFVSWMLVPLDIPARVAVTAAATALLSVAGRAGRAAAGGLALATGTVAWLVLAPSGLVLGDAPLAPLAFLVAGAALTAWGLGSPRRGRGPEGDR